MPNDRYRPSTPLPGFDDNDDDLTCHESEGAGTTILSAIPVFIRNAHLFNINNSAPKPAVPASFQSKASSTCNIVLILRETAETLTVTHEEYKTAIRLEVNRATSQKVNMNLNNVKEHILSARKQKERKTDCTKEVNQSTSQNVQANANIVQQHISSKRKQEKEKSGFTEHSNSTFKRMRR